VIERSVFGRSEGKFLWLDLQDWFFLFVSVALLFDGWTQLFSWVALVAWVMACDARTEMAGPDEAPDNLIGRSDG